MKCTEQLLIRMLVSTGRKQEEQEEREKETLFYPQCILCIGLRMNTSYILPCPYPHHNHMKREGHVEKVHLTTRGACFTLSCLHP